MTYVNVSAQLIEGGAAADQQLSRSLLAEVAAGAIQGAVRIWRPVPALALSRLDLLRPGGEEAAALAWRAGFSPVRRFTGGHAVVLGSGSLCVGFAEPAASFHGVGQRYERLSSAIIDALAGSGVNARRGELAREWCAGAWSIGTGAVKLAGLAQRTTARAAWVEAVVELAPDLAARRLLVAAYEALGLPLDLLTLGSVSEQRGSAISFDEFAAGLLGALRPRLDRSVLAPSHS